MSRHEEKARAIARLWGTDFYLTSNAIATALRDTERETAARVEREVVERCAGVLDRWARALDQESGGKGAGMFLAVEVRRRADAIRSLLPTEDGE